MCKLFVLNRNTCNHITACKLFVLNRNTCNHITVCKLFVLNRNTCNHISVCKLFVLIFTPPLGHNMTQCQFFKRSLTGLNSEFSFSKTSCLTKAEEPSLPYYLPIAGGRIIGFIPFPRVLVLCEMQSVKSRIWTRVAVSNSCDDNHYTTGITPQLFVLNRNTCNHITVCKNLLEKFLFCFIRQIKCVNL